MNRKQTVPVILALIWIVIIAWQVVEHNRFKEHARMALLNRARDITNSLATVIRSQRRFGGIVSKNRLESAMEDLIHMDELRSIALLNSFGEVVTSIGETMNADINKLPESGELWEEESVTFLNLVDLGVDQQEYDREEPRTLILTFPEPPSPPGEGVGPPPPPERFRRDVQSGTDPISNEIYNLLEEKYREEINSSTDYIRNAVNGFVHILRFEHEIPSGTAPIRDASGGIAETAGNDPRFGDRDYGRGRGDRGRGRFPRFDRPFWMDQEHYQSLLEKQGLHGFILVLSTHEFNTSLSKDIWMRSIIGAFSLLAMLGIWIAWRNLIKSSHLQLRLVRASEMNAHLREMNIAAAGLAHETRNPLNIVRGYAQMISKQDDASHDIRNRSLKIVEEVDRITAQFNEFIDYSKPREP
ncbi:MAG: histidine kinase dimerization/phospho-acceptor domain-containing protein, partial [Candidatus Hinthialibacter sp.]